MRIVIGLVRDDLGSGARPRERPLTARGTVVTALDLPRLVFSGDFQADVSTINNDVRHYDTATFEPRFQQPESGATRNGWWNPSGTGAFRLIGCTVRAITHRDPGSPADDDPVAACSVGGSASRV